MAHASPDFSDRTVAKSDNPPPIVQPVEKAAKEQGTKSAAVHTDSPQETKATKVKSQEPRQRQTQRVKRRHRADPFDVFPHTRFRTPAFRIRIHRPF
jgi:hypothetical protein